MDGSEDEVRMYELVCKDRFDTIDKSLLRIEKRLVGDSGDGICERITIVEQVVKHHAARWKWIFGICVVLIGKIGYDVLTDIWIHFNG